MALDRAGARYAISVSDNGPGIAADIQPRIFERFYRVDAARTHGGAGDGGAGLGLALARWIAGPMAASQRWRPLRGWAQRS